jgi:hypothetical protein
MRRPDEVSRASLGLLTLKQALGKACAPVAEESRTVHRTIGNWMTSYLMSAHPELGRTGDVCPFAAHASRLETIRIGVCAAREDEVSLITSVVRACCRELHDIPCPDAMRHFRAIVIGFPNVRNENPSSLKVAQSRLRFYALLRGLMIGRFHATSEDPGLWNPSFRPLRSPIPLIAIRHLTKNDAPFVVAHPILIPTFVAKFPIAGPKGLFTTLMRMDSSTHSQPPGSPP